MENPHFPPPVYGIRGVALATASGQTIIMPPPYRHHHALSIVEDPHGCDQGFWCDDNKYRDRAEALAYAVDRGLNLATKGGADFHLFSEDLW